MDVVGGVESETKTLKSALFVRPALFALETVWTPGSAAPAE